jgi:aspartate racemase
MKTIGMIGGMSWESSIEYYRIVNEVVRDRLGGLHSARSVMVSVDFAEIEALMHRDAWEPVTSILVDAAKRLENAGADVILICTNTMHKLAPEIQKRVDIPLLHIADATARKVRDSGLQKIALLGTRFTMEEDFYKGRLSRKYGLDVVVPGRADMAVVDRIIFDELCVGKILAASKEKYKKVIAALAAAGAEGIILGCTEIGLLVRPQDVELPLFDTTRIHAEAAVDFALKEG